jgi:diguanylate cyclase (GGDEF)-like protein/PAS domain S-box-containing protein
VTSPEEKTNNNQAERLRYTALENRSQELTAYIEAVGQLALVSVADRGGRILQVNAKFCEVCGYSEQELIGQDHRILNSGTHPKAFFTDMWATIERGDIWHQEICNRRKNGQLYWIDSTIVPLKGSDGQIDRYLSVRIDVSARKQKEIALRERLKEITCLYAIRRGMEQELPADEIYQRIITHLTGAMQFPEIATAVIELDGRRFASENYSQDLAHGLQAQIMLNGKTCGRLQVFYSEDRPFLLPTEQGLVEAITDDLGKWLERMQAEAARKENETLIWRQANFDSLTNLPNRHMFHDRLEQEMKKSDRTGLPLALLLFDLDHFKQINDTYGHAMGDLLLQEAALRLGSCVRESDTVARLGGDEFIVILGELDDPDTVECITQDTLRKLAEPFRLKNEMAYVSTSIGIAFYPADATDPSVLLKSADQAMYAAKSQGRNRCSYFTSAMQQAAQVRLRLVNDLRGALADDELLVYYQPIVEFSTGTVHKAEALVRWQHPTRGLIGPAEFIPIAEDTGMIVDIGDWVFREAARQAALWRASHHATFQISVNRSPVQFHSEAGVHSAWFEHLQKLGLPGQSIVVEITEGLLLDTDAAVTDQLLAFRDAGMQVSLDDFGTGYSALAYLKKFDIDYLKIDRSFVHNLSPSSNDMALCEAIIVMAHKLGLKVIAEGVETTQQRDLLATAGCDYGQGYLFSEPLPAKQFEVLLQTARQPI